jgi:branched-chain amino acid transport system permease protein
MTTTSEPQGTAASSTSPNSVPAKPRRLRGRPELYTSYGADMALLNTPAKRWSMIIALLFAVAMPFMLNDSWLQLFALAFAASVAAIGMNLVTGYAGQVSLGHAFFIGIGAYTAAALTGDVDGRQIGFGVQWIVAVPMAGLLAGLAGFIVAPLASRLRGLYLAIVTLGLVFLGEHIFKEWRSLTGGVGAGRRGVIAEVFGVRLDQAGEHFGLALSAQQKMFWVCLVVLVVHAVLARNLGRSKIGRAFAAIRDRDVAAEVMGVKLSTYKSLAFSISSFYAGIGGAMIYTVINVVEPTSFNLLMSVQYLAMILIGGVGTVSGSIMGATFITFLPRFTRELPHYIPAISTRPTLTEGAWLTVFQLEAILYGALIIGFLIFQPRGLFGLWIKLRNYWKGWPFSY